MEPPIAVPPNSTGAGTQSVEDYRATVEKLRTDAAEAALIRDLTTDPTKRELYDRLSQHFTGLAGEVERAMTTPKTA
jgi:hypothetical protein